MDRMTNEEAASAAEELVLRHGVATALKVAGERVADLERRGEWREHAVAVMVLNELERRVP